ncbi:MAG: 1-deoxy-D-xylulose-5-phosphate reductoisomerase [Bacteroidales bacterium]|nr:1-deoxy-D-xylulose-5-phosphate reductoisomerase [Bacteroidales bacterium]
MIKKLAVLGSTGSIGTQTLEVVRKNPDRFQVEVLTAQNNFNLLIQQAKEFKPQAVVIGNDIYYTQVQDALESIGIQVHAGSDALAQIVTLSEVDMVIVALVGYAGLRPTLNAIKANKQIAIANKETFVVAGEIVTALAAKYKVSLYPVDSEHSAIFQCLAGEENNPIEKIILTASGGPFRDFTKEQLKTVSKEQALKHPNWEMGSKITIDSASLMNKGLEVIEAKWLFHVAPEQIDVIIHPQSIIHSLVQFEDGSLKAQMGLPDMKLPIQYALTYPERVKTDFERFHFMDYPELTFQKPDPEKFRNLALAFEALKQGGNMPAIMNAANECAVAAFLKDEISFLQMSQVIEACMEKQVYISNPSYEELVRTHVESCKLTDEVIKRYRC